MKIFNTSGNIGHELPEWDHGRKNRNKSNQCQGRLSYNYPQFVLEERKGKFYSQNHELSWTEPNGHGFFHNFLPRRENIFELLGGIDDMLARCATKEQLDK